MFCLQIVMLSSKCLSSHFCVFSGVLNSSLPLCSVPCPLYQEMVLAVALYFSIYPHADICILSKGKLFSLL